MTLIRGWPGLACLVSTDVERYRRQRSTTSWPIGIWRWRHRTAIFKIAVASSGPKSTRLQENIVRLPTKPMPSPKTPRPPRSSYSRRLPVMELAWRPSIRQRPPTIRNLPASRTSMLLSARLLAALPDGWRTSERTQARRVDKPACFCSVTRSQRLSSLAPSSKTLARISHERDDASERTPRCRGRSHFASAMPWSLARKLKPPPGQMITAVPVALRALGQERVNVG